MLNDCKIFKRFLTLLCLKKKGLHCVHMSCVNLISLKNVVIMERVSLVGALLLLLECLFAVFKVYDRESLFEFHWSVSVNSLFIYGVFLKSFFRGIGSEEQPELCIYLWWCHSLPLTFGWQDEKCVFWNNPASLKCVPRPENSHDLTLFPLNTIISWNKIFVPRDLLSVNLISLARWLFAWSINCDISSLPVFQEVVCIRSLYRLLFVNLFQKTGFIAKRA